MTTVFAVVWSNYYPLEIESLWTTEELAKERAATLDGTWGVQQMTVFSEQATPTTLDLSGLEAK